MQLALALFFSALVTLAAVHIVSLEFYLYWKYLWLDVPIHLLGGISVALGIAILPFFRITIPWKGLGTTVFLVLIVGIAWEIFEVAFGVSDTTEEDFLLDTVIDLCMDALGGAIGYWVIRTVSTLDA